MATQTKNYKKTILISAFHSFISKNIINTDVLKILSRQPGVRVVILVDEEKKDFFEGTYGGKNIVVEGICTERILHSKITKIFSYISRALIKSRYTSYKKVEALQKDIDQKKYIRGVAKYLSFGFLNFISGNNGLFRKIFQFAYKALVPNNFFENILNLHRPDLVFATDIFDKLDSRLVHDVKKSGIPVVGMVRSWDNCYTKGVLKVAPDYLIVNNKIIKREVSEFHGVRPETVEVVGLPQFDLSVKMKHYSRREFLKKIGVDPNKRIVLFAPAGSILSNTDWQICSILKRAQKRGDIPSDVQFYVRNHPHHPADLSRFDNDPSFVLALPGKPFSKDSKANELTPDDQNFLPELLFHTDVLIWVATTLGLDAVVFDTPQIVINFDGWENLPHSKSVRRYHEDEHMVKLLATGGVSVAENEQELIKYVNGYLKDPTLHKKGRERIVREQLYKLDGKSGKRIANYILDKL